MKRFFSALLTLVALLALFSASPQAGDRPDIVHYTAQFLDRALHVTLQWQSVNPVTLVRVSAGREAKEIKVDEYDNRRVPGGYTGEVTVNVPVDATLYQKEVPFVLQLVDDLRLTSEVITGKAPLPAVVSPYGHPGGHHQDTWGQDHLKPTPKAQGGAGDIVDKLVELKDKFDLAPSITEIKVNLGGPNIVSFSLKANDDKQLREITFKVFDSQGSMVQTQQVTGLGRVWEGTSPVFRLSGGSYRVVAQAVDSSGNTSKEQSASFVVKGGPLADQPSVSTQPTTPTTPVTPTTPTVDQPPTTPTTPTTPVTPTTPTVDQPPTTPVVTTPVTPVTPVTPPMICPAGFTNCGGRCVDTRTDVANCGACGKACPPGQSCANGVCTAQTLPVVPVSELLLNGDFSRGGAYWNYETWYRQSSDSGEVSFGQPRVTFKSVSGNTRVGIMQNLNRDVSSCRTLMLKAVVRADQQTLSGTGYGGREAPISVFVGYQDANGVERNQNASLANPAEPQTNQMFWHGFYYTEPAGLSTSARGTKVQQGQWYSYVVDLMTLNPKPKILRFAGAEGAGWAPRSGALHQISLVCNGDATPLATTGAPGGQIVPPSTPATGLQPLQPPSDPVIYTNGNIAAVQNNPTRATMFSITAPYQVTWIYTYHYFNNGKQPGTIALKHSDGTLYGPFTTQGAVGQGNVPNAYWWVKPNVTIKPGTYTVIDSDPATWSHNSGSNYAGFVELRGIRLGQETPQAVGGAGVLPVLTGVWNTSEGEMALIQNGTRVTGSYSQDNGTIDGTLNGNVLDGYWTETSSAQRCPTAHNGNYHWGRIRFVFSGDTFNGAWGYCSANPDHPWTGKKR